MTRWRRVVVAMVAMVSTAAATADERAGPEYRQPDPALTAIVTAPRPPEPLVAPDGQTVALLSPAALPTIEELAAPTLRLAGFRIDPASRGPAVTDARAYSAVELVDPRSGGRRAVSLPAGARVLYPQWSPDGAHLALVVRRPDGLELWVATRDGRARALTDAALNATFGAPYAWLTVDALVVARAVDAPVDEARDVPRGPAAQENVGRAAPVRTYGDLLRSPRDERQFQALFRSQLVRIGLDGERPQELGPPGLISTFKPSPDGRYLLVERLKRPFSYAVPASRFPTEIEVRSSAGALVRQLVDRPLAEALPAGFLAVVTGPREVDWRQDAPATLVWAEALDGGDPRRDAKLRDRLVTWAAPFDGPPRTLVELEGRPFALYWGRDDAMLVVSRWWQTRREQWVRVDPQGRTEPRVLVTRNLQARYDDPGTPLLTRGRAGRPVLTFDAPGDAVYVAGDGASAGGERPYLGRLSLDDGRVRRDWSAEPGTYEPVVALLGADGRRFLTRRESRALPPEIVLRERGGRATVLAAGRDPAPAFASITPRLLTYRRADGVRLSGTLYLPPGHRPDRDPPLPLLMWVYPIDFTDAAVAGQSVDSTATRFRRPAGLSPLYLALRGYAVLDGPTMPIVGRDGHEPNDRYREQLQASAAAAIEAAVATGAIVRTRVAIGGHSYGAFTTVNLLAHTELFAAGIACSGAYNRTLTPFGFQAEQRNLWQAPDVYAAMDPFRHADRLRAPLLLVHGEADENAGTQPQQSERLFAALRGLGKTARYVPLPLELHRYRARESQLHVLWEIEQWLDRHLHTPQPTSR